MKERGASSQKGRPHFILYIHWMAGLQSLREWHHEPLSLERQGGIFNYFVSDTCLWIISP